MKKSGLSWAVFIISSAFFLSLLIPFGVASPYIQGEAVREALQKELSLIIEDFYDDFSSIINSNIPQISPSTSEFIPFMQYRNMKTDIQKEIQQLYEKYTQQSLTKITGMGSGGSKTMGIVALIIGIIMAIAWVVITLATSFAGCLAVWFICIPFLIAAIMLIIVGIMLMKAAKDVESNNGGSGAYGSIAAQYMQQAQMQQYQNQQYQQQ